MLQISLPKEVCPRFGGRCFKRHLKKPFKKMTTEELLKDDVVLNYDDEEEEDEDDEYEDGDVDPIERDYE